MEVPFQKWADHRTATGTPTVVRTVDWLRENYEGTDDAERIRTFLMEAYERWGTDFVLLGGDVSVVPSRIIGGPGGSGSGDRPVDSYYGYLDTSHDDWISDNIGGYYTGAGWSSDLYPELWVGRVPARDSSEAAACFQKVLDYESVDGRRTAAHPTSYYTTAVLAAGLTNYGSWEDGAQPSDRYLNGVYLSELVKKVIGTEYSTSSIYRYYPDFDAMGAVDCGGVSVECYKTIRQALALTSEPESPFTNTNVVNGLREHAPSLMFHMEHSSYDFLGGPTDGQADASEDVTGHIQADCGPLGDEAQWVADCFSNYLGEIEPKSHIYKESARTLSNGPDYFVGLTYGSVTGGFDRDAVVEELVRDPDGGAVCMVAKTVSTNDQPTSDATSLPSQFFDYAVNERSPLAVALSEALIDKASAGSAHRWHFFGDPSVFAWAGPPDSVVVSCDVDELVRPGEYSFTVSVVDGASPAAEGLKVTLFRDPDVYCLGWTDSNGEAEFPSVLVQEVSKPIQVWVTGASVLPDSTSIGAPGGGAAGFDSAVFYSEHTFDDSGGAGLHAGLIEPGDVVDLTVEVVNAGNNGAGAAGAKLVPNPGMVGTFLFEGAHDNDRVRIGAGSVSAPAGADTFYINNTEHGFRPEGVPTTSDGNLYLWRNLETGTFMLYADYASGDSGNEFAGTVFVDGGVTIIDEVREFGGVDTVSVAVTDRGERLDFLFEGDGSDDYIEFATGTSWVEMLADSVGYAAIAASSTDELEFSFRVRGGLKKSGRLDFLLATRIDESGASVEYSSFYLDAMAPDVKLMLLELRPGSGACSVGWDSRELVPTLQNLGGVDADSVRVTIQGCTSGCNYQADIPVIFADVDADEVFGAAKSPLKFCDQGDSATIEYVLLDRIVDGEEVRLDSLVSTYPFGPIDIDPYSDPPPNPSGVVAHPLAGGVRINWTGIDTRAGYYVYHDNGTTVSRVSKDILPGSTLWVPGLDGESGAFGVTQVGWHYSESDTIWSATAYTTVEPREGWPVKVGQGPATSVALVDIDEDSDLEIVVGGRGIWAFNHDGTPVGDGTIHLPAPDDSDPDADVLQFNGAIAVGDIDDDEDMEYVGAFGDSIIAVDYDGSVLFSHDRGAISTPVLVDADNDGDLEIFGGSTWSGSYIYAFHHNGDSYRTAGVALDGEFAVSDGSFNLAGLAAADLDDDGKVEIIQGTRNGYVRAWSTPTDVDSLLWEVNIGGFVSTPVVADADGDDDPDVIVSTTASDLVVVIEGSDGTILYCWDGVDEAPPLPASQQSPVVVSISNEPVGGQVIVGAELPVSLFTSDVESQVGLLWRDQSDDSQVSILRDDAVAPYRIRQGVKMIRGVPVVVDFDSDDEMEVLVANNQGSFFALEATWSAADSFDVAAEDGWPITYPEVAGSAAVADLDGDGYRELVVPVADGYVYVYDLASTTSDGLEWAMEGYSLTRTNDVGNYGLSRPVASEEGIGAFSLARGPNPFARSCSIRLHIPLAQHLTVSVFDVSGRRVANLVEREVEAGDLSVVWDGRDKLGKASPSGVYFIEASTANGVLRERIVVAR